MKTYQSKELDKHLNDFFSHRQDVPAHVQAQIGAKLRGHKKADALHPENNSWVGIMVLCSVVCMVMLGWTGWMLFGQAVLWVMAAVYYFLTMGGMIVMLLSSHALQDSKIIHQTGGF
jgi:hypothetical protein